LKEESSDIANCPTRSSSATASNGPSRNNSATISNYPTRSSSVSVTNKYTCSVAHTVDSVIVANSFPISDRSNEVIPFSYDDHTPAPSVTAAQIAVAAAAARDALSSLPSNLPPATSRRTSQAPLLIRGESMDLAREADNDFQLPAELEDETDAVAGIRRFISAASMTLRQLSSISRNTSKVGVAELEDYEDEDEDNKYDDYDVVEGIV
jgi:hypothetical protein